jgi:hypothetical protein
VAEGAQQIIAIEFEKLCVHGVPTLHSGSCVRWVELVRQRVLLEDLSQENLDKSDRFLAITPAEYGSGNSDVSINHDRYLFEDWEG